MYLSKYQPAEVYVKAALVWTSSSSLLSMHHSVFISDTQRADIKTIDTSSRLDVQNQLSLFRHRSCHADKGFAACCTTLDCQPTQEPPELHISRSITSRSSQRFQGAVNERPAATTAVH
jgi:hypothetical protein